MAKSNKKTDSNIINTVKLSTLTTGEKADISDIKRKIGILYKEEIDKLSDIKASILQENFIEKVDLSNLINSINSVKKSSTEPVDTNSDIVNENKEDITTEVIESTEIFIEEDLLDENVDISNTESIKIDSKPLEELSTTTEMSDTINIPNDVRDGLKEELDIYIEDDTISVDEKLLEPIEEIKKVQHHDIQYIINNLLFNLNENFKEEDIESDTDTVEINTDISTILKKKNNRIEKPYSHHEHHIFINSSKKGHIHIARNIKDYNKYIIAFKYDFIITEKGITIYDSVLDIDKNLKLLVDNIVIGNKKYSYVDIRIINK